MAETPKLKEVEEYLALKKNVEDLDKYVEMYVTPGVDGNLGVSTTVVNHRTAYDSNTSTKTFTNADFNKFAGQFFDANAAELTSRVQMFAHESLDKEREEARQEIGDLNLFPALAPFIPPQNNEVTEDAPFTYQVIAAHLSEDAVFAFDGAVPEGIVINPSTGIITGAVATSGTYNVGVKVTTSAGTGTGAVTFIVHAAV